MNDDPMAFLWPHTQGVTVHPTDDELDDPEAIKQRIIDATVGRLVEGEQYRPPESG